MRRLCNHFQTFWSRLYPWLEERIGIDTRSLAIYRIGIALLILTDLIQRAPDLEVFYTDKGLLPTDALISGGLGDPFYSSLHFINGSLWFQTLLFLLTGTFALMLLVGYRTQIFTILCWYFLISLQARNIWILHAGDALFRMLPFWGMFLPLHASYSIDNALNTTTETKPRRIFSAAAIALYIQVLVVYWSSVFFKSGPEWRIDGTAVYYALHTEEFATAHSQLLLLLPDIVLKILSFATIGWETFGPLLLICPFFSGPVRTAAILLFVLMHLGFGYSLVIGLFYWYNIVAVLVLLPTWFWDNLFHRLRTAERAGLKLYYNASHDISHKAVRLLRTFLLLPETTIVSIQESSFDPANVYWAVEDSTLQRHYGADALLVTIHHSPLLVPIAYLLSWQPLRQLITTIYNTITSVPAWPNQISNWLQYRAYGYRQSLANNLLAGFFALYIIIWTLGTTGTTSVPEPIRWIGPLLRIDQMWNVFSPCPPKVTVWFVIPGKLADGSVVDVYKNGKTVNTAKPKVVSAEYNNDRWLKYLTNLVTMGEQGGYLNQLYSRYLCQNWNEKVTDPSRKLLSVEISYMQQITYLNGKLSKPRKIMLWKDYCYDNDNPLMMQLANTVNKR